MTEWDFQPYHGYGPLTFDMEREAAERLLGPPVKVTNIYDSMKHAIDPALLGSDYIAPLKKRTAVEFPAAASNGCQLELVFSGAELVQICLRDCRGPLIVQGTDVLGKDRAAVVRDLAQREKVMLFSGSDYYFETIGLGMTAPKFWKKSGTINLYSRGGFDQEMELAGPYEYDPGEITGREQ